MRLPTLFQMFGAPEGGMAEGRFISHLRVSTNTDGEAMAIQPASHLLPKSMVRWGQCWGRNRPPPAIT
jgi:hypothetical protein